MTNAWGKILTARLSLHPRKICAWREAAAAHAGYVMLLEFTCLYLMLRTFVRTGCCMSLLRVLLWVAMWAVCWPQHCAFKMPWKLLQECFWTSIFKDKPSQIWELLCCWPREKCQHQPTSQEFSVCTHGSMLSSLLSKCMWQMSSELLKSLEKQ